MNISSAALLVEMNISVWTASVVDRKATTKVTDDAKATADAGMFKKNLMAGTRLRKEIADYAAICRTWHNGRTLPWSDKGGRLVPVSMFVDYKTEITARQSYFNAKVDTFLQEYPTLMLTAQQHLGDLFNADDYPSVEQVREKFGFRCVFSPVPEAGDFRIEVGNNALQELRDQYEGAYTSRVNDAMKTAWDKLYAMLSGMSEKLAEPEGEKTRIFHMSFVSNAHELCDLLTHLNLTKDPKLEEARRSLEAAIKHTDIDDIRGNPAVRGALKQSVDEVLKKFDW